MIRLLLIFLTIPLLVYSQESVYCIHGFMRKPSSMRKMARAFEKKGYKAIAWGYPSREKTIQEHADNLVQALKKTAQEHPGESIHFVTHSLGGIIVRTAHNHPEFPEEAKMGKAVLLAPPNQGSQFGQFLGNIRPIKKGFGQKAGKQILDSENFNYIGEFPEEKKVLVISGTYGWNPLTRGKNDGKVGFEECCLNTPHLHMSHFSGHSWIMYSETVIYNAIIFIENKKPF